MEELQQAPVSHYMLLNQDVMGREPKIFFITLNCIQEKTSARCPRDRSRRRQEGRPDAQEQGNPGSIEV